MNTLIILASAALGNPPAVVLHCPDSLAAKGAVKGGPPLAHTFELHNKGTQPLSITRVESGCGCLRQSLTNGRLAPGETAKLTIEVNTLTQPDGPNRWQIAVGYKVEAPEKPPETGELLLQITATLAREVSVQPPQLGFSTTGSASQTIVVTDRREKPLTVLKASSTSPHLSAEIGAREAGKGQSILVKLSADAPAGHRDESIVLLTDDAAYPELRIPVRVLKRVAGAVSAAPESVLVRFAAGQTEVATLVQLRATDGKPVTIASVESELPTVTVKWSPGASAVAIVRVTVAEEAAKQSGNCKVRVKLAEPAGQEVLIPVAWSVPKK